MEQNKTYYEQLTTKIHSNKPNMIQHSILKGKQSQNNGLLFMRNKKINDAPNIPASPTQNGFKILTQQQAAQPTALISQQTRNIQSDRNLKLVGSSFSRFGSSQNMMVSPSQISHQQGIQKNESQKRVLQTFQEMKSQRRALSKSLSAMKDKAQKHQQQKDKKIVQNVIYSQKGFIETQVNRPNQRKLIITSNKPQNPHQQLQDPLMVLQAIQYDKHQNILLKKNPLVIERSIWRSINESKAQQQQLQSQQNYNSFENKIVQQSMIHQQQQQQQVQQNDALLSFLSDLKQRNQQKIGGYGIGRMDVAISAKDQQEYSKIRFNPSEESSLLQQQQLAYKTFYNKESSNTVNSNEFVQLKKKERPFSAQIRSGLSQHMMPIDEKENSSLNNTEKLLETNEMLNQKRIAGGGIFNIQKKTQQYFGVKSQRNSSSKDLNGLVKGKTYTLLQEDGTQKSNYTKNPYNISDMYAPIHEPTPRGIGKTGSPANNMRPKTTPSKQRIIKNPYLKKDAEQNMVVVPFMVYTKKHSSRPVSNYKRVADILSSRDARSTSRKKTYGHHSRKGTKGLDQSGEQSNPKRDHYNISKIEMWNSSPSPYNEFNALSNDPNDGSYYGQKQFHKNDPAHTFLIDMLNNDLSNL